MLQRSRDPRVAIVSDTVDDVNGVALGLRRLVAASRGAAWLVGPTEECAAGLRGRDGEAQVVRVAAAMRAALPFYPAITWSVPALPAMIEALRGADLVQLATPGPMGIAGLVAARMLGVPVIAQYHTEVADYAARMSGLPFLAGLISPLVGWFYQQVDRCLAPSAAVVERLAGLGVARDKIARVRRGVDLALFDPARRDREEYGDGPIALYVGRLSAEKNIDGLAAAWAKIHAARPDARLFVVGEGPRASALWGEGIVQTGALFGAELATMFASADAFVFPSETETFGNVVVEAAASGLPAIVARAGAAGEHVVDGVTGAIVDGKDADAIARATLAVFAADPERRAAMRAAARTHALGYDLAAAVAATWRLYREITPSAANTNAMAIGVAS